MPSLTPGDILDPDAYRGVRTERRRAVMPVRAARRVRVGDQLVLAFENAETLTYQVQEMVAVEEVTDPDAVAAEVAAYSRLLPGPDRLVATLFIENDDIRTVRADLRRLDGIQHQIELRVGDHSVTGVEIPGLDEDGPSTVTQAVHFLAFPFDDSARRAFCDPEVPAEIRVDHPRYRDSGPIEGAARQALIGDLSGG